VLRPSQETLLFVDRLVSILNFWMLFKSFSLVDTKLFFKLEVLSEIHNWMEIRHQGLNLSSLYNTEESMVFTYSYEATPYSHPRKKTAFHSSQFKFWLVSFVLGGSSGSSSHSVLALMWLFENNDSLKNKLTIFYRKVKLINNIFMHAFLHHQHFMTYSKHRKMPQRQVSEFVQTILW